ncbi:MAG: hypothetical protein ACR2PZ_18060 [Pseudomonadales bacterium]
MATVVLGCVKEQLYGTNPPRGLYCNFPLGRPLGKPGDTQFQTQVLTHAFSLLQSTQPVIEEFAEAIVDDADEVLACPLPARHDPNAHPAVDEARGLRPAYDRASAKFGNRAGAARVVAADDIPAAIEAFVRIGKGTPWKEAGVPGIPARVAQDIRGYYELAALEIAEHTPAAWAGYRWYRDQTEAGKAIKTAQSAMKAAGVKEGLWRFLLTIDTQVDAQV